MRCLYPARDRKKENLSCDIFLLCEKWPDRCHAIGLKRGEKV